MYFDSSVEKREFLYNAEDNEKIFAKYWPSSKVRARALIQIVHGLGETAQYYEEFAELAAARGFSVYINEARGHGRTAGDVNSDEYLIKAGDIGEDGFLKMREDVFSLTRIIKKQHPGIPVFILAHSMGSVVARLYSTIHGREISGLILTGAPYADQKTEALLAIIENEIKTFGLKAPCKDAFTLMFKDLNKQFEPAETELDWITSDPSMIEESLKSPYINVLFNNEFYRYFYLAQKEVHQEDTIEKIPKSLSIYLLSGDQDVITQNGKSTEKQFEQFQKAGIQDVSYKLYRKLRHSILREISRNKVTDDILNWIEKRCEVKT